MKTRITPIKNNVFDSCNFCGSRDHPFELRSDRALVICICHQCLTSIIAQFNKPPVYGQWIDVKEQLPESKKDVLCLMYHVNRRDIQFVGCYTKGHEIEYWDDDYQGDYDEVEDKNGTLYLKPGWYECEETPGGEYDEVWVSRNVTHWMPLPKSPNE